MFTGDAAASRQASEKKLALEMGPGVESKYGQARKYSAMLQC